MTHHTFAPIHPAAWADLTTDQRVAAVRTLAAMGRTTTQIAAALATTRHAIHGVAHRCDITISDRVQRSAPLPTEPPVSEDNWIPHRLPVLLSQRADDQCAWPVGPDADRTCCGDEVHAKSFCYAHHQKAYRPAGPIAPVVELPTRQPSVNRHDRRALVHGGKAQHFEGAE